MDRHEQVTYPQTEERLLSSEAVPERLRKLMMRLANLQPGHSYGITLYLPESGEPMWAIAPQGKIEGRR